MLALVLRNLVTPFNLLNAAIIGGLFWLYFWFDDDRLLLDSIGVTTVVVINTAISIVQEWRAKLALERIVLEQQRSATIIRDGAEVSVDRSEVRTGDLLVVRRGSAIIVDGVVVEATHLEIESSFITGESAPELVDVGDEILSGSVCVSGYGLYRATRVGDEHTVAQISDLARRYEFTPSPLQRTINQIFEFSFAAAVVLALADVLLNVQAIADVDLVRRIATLLLGLIPEGLVFFTTITLTLGVYRISKLGVFVQKLNAVESFATVDTVCMDKTGTITENRLVVHSVIPFDEGGLDMRPVAKAYGIGTQDMDQVTKALAAIDVAPASIHWQKTIPFSSARKWSAQQSSTGEWIVLGAPDVLVPKPLTNKLTAVTHKHDLEHYRLLTLGTASAVEDDSLAEFRPLCLIALDDAIRPESRRTFELFDEAGIDVKILTGDAPGATIAALKAIGRTVTIQEIVRGPELAEMDTEVRHEQIMRGRVFARLRPEQKREIIKVLQKRKRHVAMVGDGVNDLPAIKEAHVGIAVAKSAEATKEIADIVLEKQTFDVFPDIVEEGRTTIRTVLNVGQLYIGKNLMLLAISALTTLTAIPYPLTPRRGALLSVVGVGLPAMILAASSRINAPVRQFIRSMLVFTAYTTVLSVVCSVATWTTFGVVLGWTESAVIECTFFGLIGILLGTFVEADNFAPTVKRTLLLLALAIAAVVVLLALVPGIPFPITILQQFYEIQTVGMTTGIGLVWSIGIGMAMALITHRLRRSLTR